MAKKQQKPKVTKINYDKFVGSPDAISSSLGRADEIEIIRDKKEKAKS